MKKIIITVFFLIIVLVNFSSNASTSYKGYAIYRDGVAFNMTWHAGIMYKNNASEYKPVIHHPGSGYVQSASWESFINNNQFKGVYAPNGNIPIYMIDSFAAMARRLKDQRINYNLIYQVNYNLLNSGRIVEPHEITGIRCDGVIEYIYEYHGYRVFGSDEDWNISRVSFDAKEEHKGIAVTPSSQSNLLTLITTEEPY